MYLRPRWKTIFGLSLSSINFIVLMTLILSIIGDGIFQPTKAEDTRPINKNLQMSESTTVLPISVGQSPLKSSSLCLATNRGQVINGTLCMKPFSLSSSSAGQLKNILYKLHLNNETYPISYHITGDGNRLSSINAERDNVTLLINVSSKSNGSLTIDLPRNVIDSKKPGNIDNDYSVLEDGQYTLIDEIKNAKVRTLTIGFDKGAQEIEIIGTQIAPLYTSVLKDRQTNITTQSTGTSSIKSILVNHPPIASAGQNKIVDENTTNVRLNGSSTDPDFGDIIKSFSWIQTAGTRVTLKGADTATPLFNAPSVRSDTRLLFNLTATDNYGAKSKPATVAITVKNVNIPPIANAGFNQTVNENATTVKLDGSKSFDKDGKIASYIWTQTAGPTIVLSGTNTATPTFTAPSVTKNTTIRFKLTVVDNNSANSTANTNVLVTNVNIPPIANSGQNQTVNENTTGVTLDGSKSFDKDGTIKSYIWTQVDGNPAVTLTAANTTKAIFTAPSVKSNTTLTFKLTVKDNDNASSSANSTVLVRNVNIPPIANAGRDQAVNENTTNVVLNGSQSYDRDGKIVSYTWKQIAGPIVMLTGSNTATPMFTAPSIKSDTGLIFKLTVTDNNNASSSTNTNVLVRNVNIPPIANAGRDQAVNENTTNVVLNGSQSYDRDGKIVSYTWKQTAGPNVVLSNPTAVSTTFTAPSVTTDTALRFNLTIMDNDKAVSAPNTVAIIVKNVNIPPIANAGRDQAVNENTTGVTLDGNKSFDKDGKIVSYKWSQISGPNVALSEANTALGKFTTPSVKSNTTLTFELTVTDNDNASSSATTSILVKNVNIRPIANAGKNQIVNESTSVILDANKSKDPDGIIKSYSWEQVSGNITNNVNGTNTSLLAFIAPNVTKDTQLAFRLRVTDDNGASDFSNVSVVVKNVNHPPIANAGMDQNVTGGESVTLNANNSKDPDSDPLKNYTWIILKPHNFKIKNFQGNNTVEPKFQAPSTTTNNTVIVFQLVVSDDKGAKSKPDLVNVTVRGILQALSETTPKNIAISPNANTSLTLFVNPPFTQENSGDSLTISGKLSNLVNHSAISGEEILIRISPNITGEKGKAGDLIHVFKDTDRNGNFEYAIPGFRQPQGSYIASAESASTDNSTALKAIQGFKVGPHPLSVNDVSTYLGVTATAIALITTVPHWVRARRQGKSLSYYIKKINDVYSTTYIKDYKKLDNEARLNRLKQTRDWLIQLLNKGKISEEHYGILDKKLSEYIDQVKKDEDSRERFG